MGNKTKLLLNLGQDSKLLNFLFGHVIRSVPM